MNVDKVLTWQLVAVWLVHAVIRFVGFCELSAFPVEYRCIYKSERPLQYYLLILLVSPPNVGGIVVTCISVSVCLPGHSKIRLQKLTFDRS